LKKSRPVQESVVSEREDKDGGGRKKEEEKRLRHDQKEVGEGKNPVSTSWRGREELEGRN